MIEIIRDINAFLSVLKESDYSTNAYLSYDYFSIYLKYNQPKKFMCLRVLDNEGKTIGLLPLQKNRTCYDIVGYRASNYLGYICKDENTQIVDSEIKDFFSKEKHFSLINYYDINSSCQLFRILSNDKRAKSVKLYSCPFVNTHQSFDELFTSQIKTKKRTEFRKFANKLSQLGDVELITINDKLSFDKYKSLIPAIFTLHELRFKEVYIPDDLCLHKNETYYSELFEKMVIKEKALLSLLTVDGVVVSFLYTLVSDKNVVDWMPAFDPAFARFNLGTVHLMKLLDYLCSSKKYDLLDFSKGAAVYKARWACGETFNSMFIRSFSKSPIVALKRFFIVFPIKVKNFLRRKGILDKIKNHLAKKKNKKCQKNNKKMFDNNPVWSIERLQEPTFESIEPILYSSVSDIPNIEKKELLDALYDGEKIVKIDRANKVIYLYK